MNRYRGKSNPAPRDMELRYAGQCRCCGATIAKGELATYYPPPDGKGRGTVAHVGGLDGNSAICAANIRNASKRVADRIDGYDRDDLGESPDY